MSYWEHSPGFEPRHVIDNYNFSQVKTFVDVGGSHGYTSLAIARRFPRIKCIVQDLGSTVGDRAKQVPPELQDQVSFMVHDFWHEQPVKDADIYFFRLIFHDWSDAYCIKILKQLIPALKKGARVLINDGCVPSKGVLSRYKERRVRALDLTVKCFLNAKEREEWEWRALFEKADARFKFLSAKSFPASGLSLMEAEWCPAS